MHARLDAIAIALRGRVNLRAPACRQRPPWAPDSATALLRCCSIDDDQDTATSARAEP